MRDKPGKNNYNHQPASQPARTSWDTKKKYHCTRTTTTNDLLFSSTGTNNGFGLAINGCQKKRWTNTTVYCIFFIFKIKYILYTKGCWWNTILQLSSPSVSIMRRIHLTKGCRQTKIQWFPFSYKRQFSQQISSLLLVKVY